MQTGHEGIGNYQSQQPFAKTQTLKVRFNTDNASGIAQDANIHRKNPTHLSNNQNNKYRNEHVAPEGYTTPGKA
jgi:hypothetical protein